MSDAIQPKRFVQPDVVVSHFHIKPGDTVADYGAGSGFFIPALAEAVGPTGRVFACEIQRQLIERMSDLVQSKGLSIVTPLWSDLETDHGAKIPDAAVDVGVLINTLFILQDKEAAIHEMYRTLRAGARLIVIDWTESFAGLGPTPAMVITEQQATDLLESNGFQLETDFPSGDHHYGLSFRKV